MIVDLLVHLVLLLLFPPLLLGVINRVKAICAGRRGAPLLQSYYDLIRLFRKSFVISKTTSWLFLAGPLVGLVAIIIAGLLIPMGSQAAPIAFAGDVIMLLYLLGLARFLTASAALDTGSPFEGMGAAREVTFACFAEPALIFGFTALARLTNSFSLSSMFSGFAYSSAAGPLLLIAVSWFVVLLVENCRIPFDDPNTHLELTMVHEVMVLDHSGPLLGLIMYGAAIKLFVVGALLANLLMGSFAISSLLSPIYLVLVLLAFALLIGLVESSMARLRFLSVPKLLVSAAVLSGFGTLLVIKA